MTTSSKWLPGRLGDPELTLPNDPRLDPRLTANLGDLELDMDAGSVVGPDSEYAEITEYIAAMESDVDQVFAEQWGDLPSVPNVDRRKEVIQGVDGNEIAAYGPQPAPHLVSTRHNVAYRT